MATTKLIMVFSATPNTDRVWYRINSQTNTFSAVQFGLVGDEPMQRDYDGDGKTDIAVVRRSNGAMIWYVLRSLDGGFNAVQFGLSTDFAAPGDFDGDGKFDYAVMRPGATSTSQSTFWILKSLTNTLQVTPWGLSGDMFVPGDYDGDGITDLAVVRKGATTASNLTWYILKSTDGGLLAYWFGTTESDSPVQNDYDGDGKADVAVWRDTDGVFYVYKSLDNGLLVIPWGFVSDLPVTTYDTR